MIDFIRAELLRLRGWAALLAGVHLVALAFASRMTDLAQAGPTVYQAVAGAYAVLGFLLGLYQVGSYRRPSTWLSLLHRPVPPARIAAALLIAAALVLLLVVALPIAIVATWQSGATARVVDLRHFALAASSLLVAAIGYLAGAYVMLRGRRQAIVVLAIAVLLATARWSGVAALAFQAGMLAWLAALVIVAFRPDPAAPTRGVVGNALAALPLQLAAFLMLLFGGYVFETLWILQGSHPNNVAMPLAGGHNEVERMDGRDRMIAALRGSASPDAPVLREQIALSDVFALDPAWPQAAGRMDLMTAERSGFVDAGRRTLWSFSRDRMRFEGRSEIDGRRAGELGVGNGGAFPGVAVPVGRLDALDEDDMFLVAGDALYQFDAQARRIVRRIRLPTRIVGVAPVGENLAVLGTDALYFVEGRDLALPDGELTAHRRLRLPAPIDDLSRTDIIERVEGHLVVLTYSAHAHEITRTAPFQIAIAVDDAGTATVIARRTLRYDYPALFRYRGWWPSPVMHAVFNLVRGAVDVPAMRPAAIADMPRVVLVTAFLLMLASGAIAIGLTRRLPLRMPGRIAWVAVCALVGVPAVVALALMYAPEYRLRMAAAMPRPATVPAS